MRAYLSVTLVLAVALAGCVNDDLECPITYRAPNLGWMVGDAFGEFSTNLRDRGREPAHPYTSAAGDRRIEVTSDSTVSLVYERAGELVVETYAVTGTVARTQSW